MFLTPIQCNTTNAFSCYEAYLVHKTQKNGAGCCFFPPQLVHCTALQWTRLKCNIYNEWLCSTQPQMLCTVPYNVTTAKPVYMVVVKTTPEFFQECSVQQYSLLCTAENVYMPFKMYATSAPQFT